MEGFDLQTFFFLIIFLVISAFSWIVNKIQEAKSRRNLRSPGEIDRPQPRQQAKPTAAEKAEELSRRLFESLGIPVDDEEEKRAQPQTSVPRKTPPPPRPTRFEVPPPPPPLASIPTAYGEPRAPSIPVLTAEERAALKRIQQGDLWAAPRLRRAGAPGQMRIQDLLTPANIGKAVILKEILDEPKGMRF